MKFAITTLVLVAISAVSGAAIGDVAASAVEQPLRLPLPVEIAAKYPWLLNEKINPEFDFVKIVGGSNAASGEAPYQIALLRSNSFTCGGSIIGSQTVLTAAHCVYGSESRPSYFTVRYNTIDRTRGTDLKVSKITRHPSYSSSTIDYDVALLSLASPITPSTNAAIVQLASSAPSAGTTGLLLTGWGRLSGGGSLPTTLQKSTGLKVVSQSECQSRWGSSTSITARMLCAHSTTQSACNGDSGGPLVLNGLQVGIVSWGSSSCLHATYPNVYSNVANLRSWINSNA